jgi:hypothetical protein
MLSKSSKMHMVSSPTPKPVEVTIEQHLRTVRIYTTKLWSTSVPTKVASIGREFLLGSRAGWLRSMEEHTEHLAMPLSTLCHPIGVAL